MPLADIEPQKVDWLWEPYVPAGKLVILAGEGGLGKTTIAIDLAARVSCGAAMPGGQGIGPATVVFLSAEDGLADTIRPRFEAAGADLDRVLVQREGDPLITLQDTAKLERMLTETGARMLVLDPMSAFLGCDYVKQPHRVRALLTPLAQAAARFGVAVLIVAHFTKSAAGKAVHRVEGAAAIGNCVRSLLVLGPDPRHEGRLALAHAKSNLAPPGPSWSLERSPGPGGGALTVRWVGECQVGADELADVPPPGEATKVAQAEEMLRELLAEGPLTVPVLKDHSEERGIGWRTAETAKKRLGLRSRRTGGPTSPYEWSLPVPDGADV